MNARNGTTAEEQQSALDEAVRALTLPEGVAWGFALVFFVVGDMATTAIGLGLGAVELSPGGIWLLELFGMVPGMVVGKSVVLAMSVAFFLASSHYSRVGIPAALGALGYVITARNALVVGELAGLF